MPGTSFVRREQLASYGRDAEPNRRLGDEREAGGHLPVPAGTRAAARVTSAMPTPAERPVQRAIVSHLQLARPRKGPPWAQSAEPMAALRGSP